MSVAIVSFVSSADNLQFDRLRSRGDVVDNDEKASIAESATALSPSSHPSLTAITPKSSIKADAEETPDDFIAGGVLCRVIDKNNKKAGVLKATSISSSSTDYFNVVMRSPGWSYQLGTENIGALTVNIMGDIMGEDHLIAAMGHGWFWDDYRLKFGSTTNNSNRPYALLNFYLELIHNANWIIAADVDNKSKGESYAMRAYAYFNLAQLYQQTYDGNQDKPCVPLYLSTDFSAEFQRSKLATVAEVYQQIDSDLDAAISLLADYKALNYETENNTYVEHINYYIANGIKARVSLVKHDFATAELAAAEALKMPGLTLANSVAEITPLNSIRQPGILWGEYISPEEHANYASFYSHMDADYSGHYAASAHKCISTGLYKLIPATDARRSSWWENGNSSRAYNQIKYRGVYSENPQYDYIYMRAEEMILIMAEAQCALGRYSDARTTITRLVEKRDSEYGTTLSAMTDSKEYNSDTNASPATLMDYILLQRRIELWGENPRIFDLQRLHLGYNRNYSNSNHPIKLEDKNTSAGSELFIIPLPAENVWAAFHAGNTPDYLLSDNANVIPETVSHNGVDYVVTEILEGAYDGLSASKVNVPKTIDSIDKYAFCGLSGVEEFTVDANNNNYTTSNGVLFSKDGSQLIRYPDKKADVTYSVPSTVKSISEYAFEGAENLKQVILHEGLENVGGASFYNCKQLESVNIPSSINIINAAMFYGCERLTSVDIPNSITEIGRVAFYGCSGLTSIDIPDSVTLIGRNAFFNTVWFDNQPDGLVYAGLVAYQYKGTMPSNTAINIKDGTASISPFCFSDCSGLTSIDIPNSVTSIGMSAFQSCSGLTSVTIPNSVTSIGMSAFNGCSGLTSIEISNSIASIESNTFTGCSGLTSVTIPNSVTSIGRAAFGNCTGLTSMTIPNSVTSIGDYAFYNCSGLTDVWNYSKSPQAIADNTFSVFNKLHVPKSAVGAYTATDVWKNFEVIGFDPYGETLTFDKDAPTHDAVVIGFDNSTPDVIIPETITVDGVEYEVTGVADEAFRNCDNLKSVEIPATVREVGESAFRGCSSLERVVLPDLSAPAATLKHLSTKAASTNLLIIGDYAFADCSALNEVRNNSLAPQAVNETVFSGVDVSNCKLYVPEQSMNLYKEAAIWKDFIIEGFVGVEDIFIDRPSIEKTVVGYYDLRGIRHDEPVRGQINIVLFSDGTAKKVIVK